MAPYPALRHIDAVPIQHEGSRLICISDTSGFVEEQLLLSPPAFFVAANLDGKNDHEAIQRLFRQQFAGSSVGVDQIQGIVDYLDEHGFLASARFEAIRNQCIADFQALPERPAYCAGRVYPENPDELRAYCDAMLGELPTTAGQESTPALRCLITPHIDFDRGAPGYAAAYGEMRKASPPGTVIIFGVAHAGASVPFVLTRKAFQTPFGALETDQEVLDQLEAACDWEPYADELVHRTEHSVEFQAVMLAHLYGPQVKIVPVLCASLCGETGLESPAQVPGVQRFLDACARVVRDSGKKISVIAGADLAHVGKRFGDDFEISDEIICAIEQRDREDLACVASCDPDAFYESVMQDDNDRRVCGLFCIYAALKAVDGTVSSARTLHYGYAPDPSGGIVSFASMALI